MAKPAEIADAVAIVPVRNVTATVAFYKDFLGFEARFVSQDESFATVTRGEALVLGNEARLEAQEVLVERDRGRDVANGDDRDGVRDLGWFRHWNLLDRGGGRISAPCCRQSYHNFF